mmetsp:Transcript_13727/g.26082  ORF Transcript_13727/g.26082 Transcript_13727/m.26082 type:complete len:229 (+) Transcript_13727:1817-2503(+)
MRLAGPMMQIQLRAAVPARQLTRKLCRPRRVWPRLAPRTTAVSADALRRRLSRRQRLRTVLAQRPPKEQLKPQQRHQRSLAGQRNLPVIGTRCRARHQHLRGHHQSRLPPPPRQRLTRLPPARLPPARAIRLVKQARPAMLPRPRRRVWQSRLAKTIWPARPTRPVQLHRPGALTKMSLPAACRNRCLHPHQWQTPLWRLRRMLRQRPAARRRYLRQRIRTLLNLSMA